MYHKQNILATNRKLYIHDIHTKDSMTALKSRTNIIVDRIVEFFAIGA